MSIMELGALGEFLGSIGVIATLIYLAMQISHNTRSMDESRKLAMAQTYEARAINSETHLQNVANSDHMAGILTKIRRDDGVGWEPTKIDALAPEERMRLEQHVLGRLQRFDNIYYQHQSGLLDEEYYEHNFKNLLRLYAPLIKALGMTYYKPSFRAEVERILAE